MFTRYFLVAVLFATGISSLVGLTASPDNIYEDVEVDEPYSTRIKNAISGFVFGWIALIFSILLLWVVESAAVDFDLLLARCRKATKVIEDPNVSSSEDEGRPIFVTGKTNVDVEASGASRVTADNATGFKYVGRGNIVSLKRVVSMYQWVEHEKKEEKKTIYHYEREWSELDHISSSFRESLGHYNPPRSPHIYSERFSSYPVSVGAYVLSSEQLEQFHKWDICAINDIQNVSNLHGHVEQAMKVHTNTKNMHFNNLMEDTVQEMSDFIVYNGKLNDPQIGTVRVSYEAIVDDGDVSLIGVKSGHSFRAFTKNDAYAPGGGAMGKCKGIISCSAQDADVGDYLDDSGASCNCCMALAKSVAGVTVGNSLLLVEERKTTPSQMYWDENVKFGKRLYVMRFVGCLGISIGIYGIFNPIAVLLSFIPYLSSLLSSMFFLVALIIGFTLGVLIISISWISHRPEYNLVVLGTLGTFFFISGKVMGGCIFFGLTIIPIVLVVIKCMDERAFVSYFNGPRNTASGGMIVTSPFVQNGGMQQAVVVPVEKVPAVAVYESSSQYGSISTAPRIAAAFPVHSIGAAVGDIESTEEHKGKKKKRAKNKKNKKRRLAGSGDSTDEEDNAREDTMLLK